MDLTTTEFMVLDNQAPRLTFWHLPYVAPDRSPALTRMAGGKLYRLMMAPGPNVLSHEEYLEMLSHLEEQCERKRAAGAPAHQCDPFLRMQTMQIIPRPATVADTLMLADSYAAATELGHACQDVWRLMIYERNDWRLGIRELCKERRLLLEKEGKKPVMANIGPMSTGKVNFDVTQPQRPTINRGYNFDV